MVDVLVGGQTAYWKRFQVDYKGPIYPFGCHIRYLPITEKDKQRCHGFGRKYLDGIFNGYVQLAGGGWQGDLTIVDWEEVETATHHNNIHRKRFKADEIKPVGEIGEDGKFQFHFPLKTGDLKQPDPPTSTRRTQARKARQDKEKQEQAEASKPDDAVVEATRESQPPPDIVMAKSDFWTCNGTILIRHHRTPRTDLYVPSDETCPIPTKWLDIFRRTETSLDHLRESEVKDYWTEVKTRPLSGQWTGRTVFDILKIPPKPGHKYVLGREIKYKRGKTFDRPDSIMPEDYGRMNPQEQYKEHIRWTTIEKPAQDAARQARDDGKGITYVKDEDREAFDLCVINAKEKHKYPLSDVVAPAMPCTEVVRLSRRQYKLRQQEQLAASIGLGRATASPSAGSTSQDGAIVRTHEDKIPDTGWGNWINIHDELDGMALIHKPISIPQAHQIPAAKAALDREWAKLEDPKKPVWDVTKVQPRAKVEARGLAEGRPIHFGALLELCSIKHFELKQLILEYKGRVCFRGDTVKTEEGTHAVFSEQGTSSAHMASTKFLDWAARLPENDGQDADAVGAYCQMLLEEAAELLGIDVIPETWISLPPHKQPDSWKGIKDPVCPLVRNIYGHPLAGLLWEKGSQQRILRCGFEKVKGWESLYLHRKLQVFLGVYVDDFHLAGRKKNLPEVWRLLKEEIDLDPPVPFNGNTYLGCLQNDVEIPEEVIHEKTIMFRDILHQTKKQTETSSMDKDDKDDYAGFNTDTDHPALRDTSATEADEPHRHKRQLKKKLLSTKQRNKSKSTSQEDAHAEAQAHALHVKVEKKLKKHPVRAWQYKMEGAAKSAVDRYLELSKCDRKTLTKVATPCIDDHLIAPEDFEAKGHLHKECSKCVLKCLYLARLARPDLLWTVNSLARNVTRWSVADDKRLHRLISFINCTDGVVMTSYAGDEAKYCKLMLFVDASFAGDLKGSKSTTGAFLCVVGPRTFCPICWLCKKQGAISHSSSEAEVIALDAGVRMEGIPSLDLMEEIINVFDDEDQYNPPQLDSHSGNLPQTKSARKRDVGYHVSVSDTLQNVDHVPPNIVISRGRAKLIICEDNDAVIKMCVKARSLNMRHVPRVHRVDLDWLFERLLKDTNITMKYVNTKQQMADIFTKGSFTAATWKELSSLLMIGPSFPLVDTRPAPSVAVSVSATLAQAPIAGPVAAIACSPLLSNRTLDFLGTMPAKKDVTGPPPATSPSRAKWQASSTSTSTAGGKWTQASGASQEVARAKAGDEDFLLHDDKATTGEPESDDDAAAKGTPSEPPTVKPKHTKEEIDETREEIMSKASLAQRADYQLAQHLAASASQDAASSTPNLRGSIAKSLKPLPGFGQPRSKSDSGSTDLDEDDSDYAAQQEIRRKRRQADDEGRTTARTIRRRAGDQKSRSFTNRFGRDEPTSERTEILARIGKRATTRSPARKPEPPRHPPSSSNVMPPKGPAPLPAVPPKATPGSSSQDEAGKARGGPNPQYSRPELPPKPPHPIEQFLRKQPAVPQAPQLLVQAPWSTFYISGCTPLVPAPPGKPPPPVTPTPPQALPQQLEGNRSIAKPGAPVPKRADEEGTQEVPVCLSVKYRQAGYLPYPGILNGAGAEDADGQPPLFFQPEMHVGYTREQQVAQAVVNAQA